MNTKLFKQVLTLAIAFLMIVNCFQHIAPAAEEVKDDTESVEEVVALLFSGSVEKEAVIANIPGAALAIRESVRATSTIQAIDAASRQITLLTEDEKSATFTAGPAMEKFGQLAVGDVVLVTYTEALALYVDKDAAAEADAVAGVARSVDAPAGALFGGIKVTADVLEVDADKRYVKLELADKSLREMIGSEGVDFSKIQVGDAITLAIGKVFQVEVKQ